MSTTENYPITFYYSDNCDRQAIEPIADEATIHGFSFKESIQNSRTCMPSTSPA